MAKPRVFISSSYYDLKHFLFSLDLFIAGLGFESILSEKGSIAYNPDQALDESCYREAQSAGILVLLIGGRYGSAASGEEKGPTRQFFERYDSITKKEYESAIQKDIPTHIMIEANVYAEYQTFLKNKDNDKISYAHVDSVNVFHLIDEILAKPRNNPTHTFERFSDIEAWLKEQWVGLFRELLNRRSQQQQIATLSLQVAELKEIGATLRKYLETVVTTVNPGKAPELIDSENKRLHEQELRERLRVNNFFRYMVDHHGLSEDQAISAMRAAKLNADFVNRLGRSDAAGAIARTLHEIEQARIEWNEARAILGLKPFEDIPKLANATGI